MASADYADYRKVAIEAAQLAGNVILEAWDKPRSVIQKGDVDLVTDTDHKCETMIMEHIHGQYPDHKFIGEEGSAAAGVTAELTDEPTWIIDPVDGTTNFVHMFPFVCVCIALAIGKQVVTAVVYNPVLKETFLATRGCGATLNDTSIKVSSVQDLKKALIATEIGTTRDTETMDAIFDRMRSCTSATRSLRCAGSCALNLCGTAMGRLDAFYEVGFGGPWDVAAASLIVQEAGGLLLDPSGAPFDLMGRRVLGGSPNVVKQLAGVLNACKTSAAEPAAPALT